MRWTQIDITGPEELEELAAACLYWAGCSGVQVIRQEDLPEFEEEWKLPERPRRKSGSGPESEVTVRAFLPEGREPSEEVRSAAALSGNPRASELKITVGTVEDTGWARSWRKFHRPSRVGKRLVVVPSWSRYRARKDDLPLIVDPGMAFGSGQHATTRLCLEALEEYVFGGDRVVDVGCGSGILSIAAAKLGAANVLAIDNDCLAVATTAENLKINHVEDVVTVQASTLEAPYPSADIVVANILAPVIKILAPAARAVLMAGRGCEGVFISSGIVRHQEQDVRQALEREGLALIRRWESGEWICLAARPR